MPLTDESVLFREKEGGGYGGDPTWTAEAIVRLDQDASAKRGEGSKSEPSRNSCAFKAKIVRRV